MLDQASHSATTQREIRGRGQARPVQINCDGNGGYGPLLPISISAPGISSTTFALLLPDPLSTASSPKQQHPPNTYPEHCISAVPLWSSLGISISIIASLHREALIPLITLLDCRFQHVFKPTHITTIMSVVSLLGVQVTNNPAKFTDKYVFEITFECLEQLEKGWATPRRI